MTEAAAVTCAWCGATAAPAPPTWTMTSRSAGPGGPEWLCERCTREQVRNIESKLERSWW